MGLSGSRPVTEIYLNETKKPFYWAGEVISGTVVVQTDQPLHVQNINLTCVGELFYQTTIGNPTGTAITFDNNCAFFTANKRIFPSIQNRANGMETIELAVGKHSWPFSIQLANNLPPSLNTVGQEKPPCLRYYLDLSARDSANSARSLYKIPITVIPCIGVPSELRPIDMDDKNRNGVHIRTRLHHNYLLVGQLNFPMEVSIRNPNHSRIKQVVIELKRYSNLGDDRSHRSVLYKTVLPSLVNFEGSSLDHTCLVPIQWSNPDLVPTFNYKPSSDDQSWSVDYKLKVIFVMAGPFADISFKIPLAIINNVESDKQSCVSSI